jgi:hypothetical protein
MTVMPPNGWQPFAQILGGNPFLVFAITTALLSIELKSNYLGMKKAEVISPSLFR